MRIGSSLTVGAKYTHNNFLIYQVLINWRIVNKIRGYTENNYWTRPLYESSDDFQYPDNLFTKYTWEMTHDGKAIQKVCCVDKVSGGSSGTYMEGCLEKEKTFIPLKLLSPTELDAELWKSLPRKACWRQACWKKRVRCSLVNPRFYNRMSSWAVFKLSQSRCWLLQKKTILS